MFVFSLGIHVIKSRYLMCFSFVGLGGVVTRGVTERRRRIASTNTMAGPGAGGHGKSGALHQSLSAPVPLTLTNSSSTDLKVRAEN